MLERGGKTFTIINVSHKMSKNHTSWNTLENILAAYLYIDSPFKHPLFQLGSYDIQLDRHNCINLTYLPIVIFSFEFSDAVILKTALTISRCSNFTQSK